MPTTGTFGQASTGGNTLSTGVGQSGGLQFTAPATASLFQVTINAVSVSVSGDWLAQLWSDSAGSPGSQVGSSSAAVTISASGDKLFTFGTPPSLTSATVYWLVITPSSGTPNFIMDNCADQVGYASGRNNTVTSIAAGSGGITADWRVEILYGTNASVNLTGNAGTGAVGTPVASVAASAAGVAGSGAVGSLLATSSNILFDLTGVSASGAVGTLTAFPFSSVFAAGQVGSLTAGPRAHISGVSGTGLAHEIYPIPPAPTSRPPLFIPSENGLPASLWLGSTNGN